MTTIYLGVLKSKFAYVSINIVLVYAATHQEKLLRVQLMTPIPIPISRSTSTGRQARWLPEAVQGSLPEQ